VSSLAVGALPTSFLMGTMGSFPFGNAASAPACNAELRLHGALPSFLSQYL
jgi:hypothetical protein